jgi:hypothetical protein
MQPVAVEHPRLQCENAPTGTATGNRNRMAQKRKRQSRFTRSRRRWMRWPTAAQRKRWWKRYRRLGPWTQVAVAGAAFVCVWLAINFIYQVMRKPSELFFPVSGVLYKHPAETWDSYGAIFERHSTTVISPELLAALAQTEASGNPIARTYWRWSLTHKPFEVYRPASSAVGMYQITDGTFEQSRQYCIHDHEVVEDGPWHAWRSCWFNALYTRVIPTHATELTSAYLHSQVMNIVGARRVSPSQRETLATLIHLCGAGAGQIYARRGFRLLAGQRCGDHSAASYVRRVETMKREFARLRQADSG